MPEQIKISKVARAVFDCLNRLFQHKVMECTHHSHLCSQVLQLSLLLQGYHHASLLPPLPASLIILESFENIRLTIRIHTKKYIPSVPGVPESLGLLLLETVVEEPE